MILKSILNSIRSDLRLLNLLENFRYKIRIMPPNAIIKMEEPPNWQQTIENIRQVRKKFPAPVDSMGCDQCHDKQTKTVDQRFQILCSLMLSSQTKDPITWKAVQNLRENGLGNVKGLLQAKEKDIEDLIFPVGFYRRKAIYLKKMAEELMQKYDGDIPDSVEALCKLPGVGPKMAHLCMQEAWDVNSGIGVDVHVHRISARLGWVPRKGIKTPEDTRKALESWLPKEYWTEINRLLVGFGQTICTPIGPKCDECFNNPICPKIDVVKRGGKSAKSKVKIEAQEETNDSDGPVSQPTMAEKGHAKRKKAGRVAQTKKVKAESVETQPLKQLSEPHVAQESVALALTKEAKVGVKIEPHELDTLKPERTASPQVEGTTSEIEADLSPTKAVDYNFNHIAAKPELSQSSESQTRESLASRSRRSIRVRK